MTTHQPDEFGDACGEDVDDWDWLLAGDWVIGKMFASKLLLLILLFTSFEYSLMLKLLKFEVFWLFCEEAKLELEDWTMAFIFLSYTKMKNSNKVDLVLF
jgi:hypothetical protein